jgi:branched-chain amino acid transport system permease protein
MSGSRQGNKDALQGLAVQRWTGVSRVFTSGVGLVAILLALVPLTLSANVVQKLTSLFILVMLAVTWNALAGYGGLLSVGQQVYFGIGAYGTVLISQQNVNPYLAMVLAVAVTGLMSVPISYVLLRLRGGQFSIATWVIAEAFVVLVSLVAVLGAGTGISLSQLNRYTIAQRQHFTFWLALALMAGFIAAVFILVRSRTGMSLQAIRDDEDGAASVGVRVLRGKRILYILAALGSGAAGAMTLANTLFIAPSATFSIQWSAFMVFMVLVGGLGTFEGPILGAIILFFIRDTFAAQGAWYLIGLGLVAILFALFLPAGIWGTVEKRFGLQLMPVGYRIRGLGSKLRPALVDDGDAVGNGRGDAADA